MSEPHTTMLAFGSAAFLAAACFLAGGIWLMLWTRNRAGYMLPTALSWWAFCAYFGALAVSAGADPMITRVDIAGGVRLWGFVVGASVIASKLVLLAVWRRRTRCARGNST